MAPNEKLTPSEKIIAFLDGELPESDTSELFNELSQDPELQEEMRQHTLLRGWMPKVLPPPPPYLKRRIAGALGFSGITRTIRFAFLALLLVSVAGGAIYFGVNGTFKSNPTNVAANNNYYSKPAATASNPAPPELLSKEEASIAPVKSDRAGYRFVAKKSEGGFKEVAPEDLQALTPVAERAEPTDIDLSLTEDKEPALTRKRSLPYPIYLRNSKVLESLSNLSFSIRKVNSLSVPYLDLDAPGSSLIGDYILGLDYSLGNGDAIGVEVGNETISQVFSGKVKGSKAIYKQVYRGFWGAALYRYTLPALAKGTITPQVSVGAGYYEMGPLCRASAGADYYLTDNFIISVRAESSMFFYSYDRTPYVTVKPGISYGLKFKM